MGLGGNREEKGCEVVGKEKRLGSQGGREEGGKEKGERRAWEGKGEESGEGNGKWWVERYFSMPVENFAIP